MRKLYQFAIAMLCLPSNAGAQTVNISIDATSNDDIGRQIVMLVRQKVASSPLMNFVSSNQYSSIKLKVVTLSGDNDQATENFGVYTEVLLLHSPKNALDSYLTSSVGTCGRNKIEQCADSIVADLDQWGDVVRKAGTNASN
jgi:hypothetical protein